MKLKVIMALVALAGLAAALALASPTRAGDGTGTTSTQASGEHHGKKGEEHGKKDDDDDQGNGAQHKSSCRNLELKGAAGSGTVSFTVSRGDHKAASLAGKQVTVTIPAGSSLSVQACQDANGALTLRGLHVGKNQSTSTSTPTTTTSATAAVPGS